MLTNRLFNFFVVVILVALMGLTAWEVSATAAVVSQENSSATACASLPSRFFHSYRVCGGRGAPWMAYTEEEGPTGVDGGLIYLLSKNRECGR